MAWRILSLERAGRGEKKEEKMPNVNLKRRELIP
jgi:hypothetical protein